MFSETSIEEFIRETEKDLLVAKQFLAMVKRRNGTIPLPSMEPVPAQIPLIKTHPQGGEYGANKRWLLAAIEKCPLEYTIYDIEKALVELGNPLERPVIQQAMSRFVSKGEVYVLKKGAGPKPSTYTKKDPFSAE